MENAPKLMIDPKFYIIFQKISNRFVFKMYLTMCGSLFFEKLNQTRGKSCKIVSFRNVSKIRSTQGVPQRIWNC